MSNKPKKICGECARSQGAKSFSEVNGTYLSECGWCKETKQVSTELDWNFPIMRDLVGCLNETGVTR